MLELIALLASLVTVLGGGWGVVKWFLRRRDERYQKATEKLGSDERYQKAVEKLGSGKFYLRLAGVDELQRLAEGHPRQYHVQVMRRLCDFVRHPPRDEDGSAGSAGIKGERDIKACVKALMIPDDVQSAMEAIGTRSEADVELENNEKFKPDSSGAQLSGVDLSKRKANLSGVDLSAVVFAPPDLIPLDLSLEECLKLPRITAILTGADLRGAKLVEADLTDADLTGVDLRGAKGITQEQLELARSDSANPAKVDLPLEPPRNMPYINFVDRLAGERRRVFDRLERER